MIIYLDKTIYEHFEQNELDEKERNLFLSLALSHHIGNCYVCGDFRTLDYLTRVVDSQLYKKIRNKNVLAQAIIDEVETLVVLSYGGSPQIPDFINGKCETMKIMDALDYSINERCALVAENLSDCIVYKMVGIRFILERNLNGVSLSFRDQPGGGSTISDAFGKCVEDDKNFTLCLVDSDVKRKPTKTCRNIPANGETAGNVLSKYKELKRKEKILPFAWHCDKTIHEIENIIPLSIWEQTDVNGNPNNKKVILILTSLAESQLESALLLYDLKHGDKKLQTEEEMDYWIEIGDIIGWPFPNFPGLGDKALENAIKVLEADECYKTIEIDDYLKDIWSSIGKKIFSWGCSNRVSGV